MSEVIDVPDEAVIEETSTNKEVQEGIEAIENLQFIQKHIKKFGVTKEFLHLVNTDNQLGKALNITLPYYESDEEEINEENIPSEEVVMEGIGDKIKELKNNVLDKFSSLSKSIKENWQAFLDIFKNLDEEMKNLKERAKNTKKKFSSENLREIELKGIKETELRETWTKLLTAVLSAEYLSIKIGRQQGDKVYDFAVPRKAINEGLVVIGKEIERDEKGKYIYKKNDKSSIEMKDSNAKDLGYNKEFFIKFCSGYEFFSKVKKVISEIEGTINEGRNVAEEILMDSRDYEDIRLLRNNMSIVFKAYSELLKEMIFYSKYVLNLSKKFNF